jgi:hypothetical protein
MPTAPSLATEPKQRKRRSELLATSTPSFMVPRLIWRTPTLANGARPAAAASPIVWPSVACGMSIGWSGRVVSEWPRAISTTMSPSVTVLSSWPARVTPSRSTALSSISVSAFSADAAQSMEKNGWHPLASMTACAVCDRNLLARDSESSICAAASRFGQSRRQSAEQRGTRTRSFSMSPALAMSTTNVTRSLMSRNPKQLLSPSAASTGAHSSLFCVSTSSAASTV